MNLNVTFLDVYHGDCAIITLEKASKKFCILVDGGATTKAAKRIATYLKFENIQVIDLLVGTHIDEDHINGLKFLLRDESSGNDSWNKGKKKCIRNYWGPKPDPDWIDPKIYSPAGIRGFKPAHRANMNKLIKSIGQNQELHKLVEQYIFSSKKIYFPSLQELPPLNIFNDLTIELLAPDEQILDTELKSTLFKTINLPYQNFRFSENDNIQGKLTLNDVHRILAMNAEHMAEIADRTANNQSIVFKIYPKNKKSKKWSFLFTGDADTESWDMIRARTSAKNLKSKVLKVPHHGSINGIDEESFKKIKPHYSIVSAGQSHGLPDAETLNLIKHKISNRLFCTERNNKTNKPGPCLNKANCPRSTKNDFRSLRFKINLSTGSRKIDMFKFSSNNKNIVMADDEIWCPETQW